MKNKVKKIIPYGLILIVIFTLVGFFSPMGDAQAQTTGACFRVNPSTHTEERIVLVNVNSQTSCEGLNPATRNTNFNQCVTTGGIPPGYSQFSIQNCAEYFSVSYWVATATPTPINPNPGTIPCTGQDANGAPTPAGCTPTASSPAGETDFQRIIRENSCGLGWATGGGSVPGCFVQIFYIIFYTIPAYLLWASAQFFNVLIAITLGSKLLSGATFVSAGWAVVRDLSNIFFILILLYIAVKLILGLGGSEVKKMIVNVIIMALLINFSMFMTKVVIDTSNILALVFYNKISVTGNANYISVLSKDRDKDISGGMMGYFDPT